MDISSFHLYPNIYLRRISFFHFIIIVKFFSAQLQGILAKYLLRYNVLAGVLKEFTGIKESSRHSEADDFTPFVMLNKRDNFCVALKFKTLERISSSYILLLMAID